MSLAALVKRTQKETEKTLGGALFEHLKKRPPRIKQPMKEGDYYRISGLPYLCAREEVLASREDIVRVENIAPGLQITFDIGHAFHDIYRDWFFGPMEKWAGAWKCRRCGWDTDKAGLSHSPVKGVRKAKVTLMPKKCPDCGALRLAPCKKCGESRIGAVCQSCGNVRDASCEDMDDIGMLTFLEWTVKDPKIRLRGHPDGWRPVRSRKPVLGDLKSHSSNGFVRRSSPRDGHDVQIWGYQHCADEIDRKGEVIYMNKSPWGDHTSFIREFVAPFNKERFNLEVKEPLLSLQNGLSGGKLPERVCVSSGCPRAKECQLQQICWG